MNKRAVKQGFIWILFLSVILFCAACSDADAPEKTSDSRETAASSGEASSDAAETGPFLGEVSADKAKRILLTIPVSGEAGELFYDNKNFNSFVAKDGVIGIIDTKSRRVIIYRSGAFSEIDISGIPMARHVCVQDGKIAVIDTFNKMTGIYSLERESIISVLHPEELKRDTPVAVVGIDGNSLIWETDRGLRYRYNWTKRTLEALDTEQTESEYEVSADLKEMTVTLKKVLGEERAVYVTIDMSDWTTTPAEYFYISDAGNVYLMECFSDRTVISQIVLDERDVMTTPEGTDSSAPGGGSSAFEHTYTVHVPVLNREIEVPENRFVYWIDGIYLDRNRKLAEMDFAKWMVVTDQEYTEAELSRQILENPEEAAVHILYCLEIIEKRELYPLTAILLPPYAENGSEFLQLRDNGTVRLLSPRLVIDIGSPYLGNAWVSGYPSEDELQEMIPYGEWNEILFGDAPELTNLSGGFSHHYFGVDRIAEDVYRNTVISNDWWEEYREALEKLKAEPERFGYSEREKDALIAVTQERYEALKQNRDLPEMTRIYTDPEQELYLRAACYASNWGIGDTVALEDRAIVFQEWPDGHRSYMECIRMEDGSGYRIAKSGYDCWGAGFEVLREYLAKYYPELKDTNPE